ncbi:aminoglycoside phosphotransferase APH(3') [Rathayibacter sp. AY1E3]|uniref:aminoglycoside 3'-phosphotransferase n=1 Tax=Rathayibacter sp. AY1E3 TaxID=2080551 RepID=UPI000CE76214|nr:aminoglycoside 3'-phosphotransferase [Rathayibacter sp. AY1E3]PPH36618.1 aminoglycoside phosphotransferase APH(3') [Rathayibacter sp. AY1E3]
MSGPDLARQFSLDGVRIPSPARRLNGGTDPALVWRNELDGLTFRVDAGYLKWNPRSTGVDLRREIARLRWLEGRIDAPRILEAGEDEEGQWLLTAPLPGQSAVDPKWTARPEEAVRAIAAGLRAVHALPVDAVPEELRGDSWFARRPSALGAAPELVDPVVVHGDACAPNTLVDDDGRWSGTVDVGDLGVGDRWADLAVAAVSLGWNYGPGHTPLLLAEYGADPDDERAAYYRALWSSES